MKIALLTNILSPYRKVFYDKLYMELKKNNIDFKVFVMADGEDNRAWKYEDYKGEYTILLKSKTISITGTYLHINPDFKQRLFEFKPDILIASGSYTSPTVWTSIRLKSKMSYKLFFWSESHLDEVRNYNNMKLAVREFVRNIIYKKFDGFWYAGEKSLNFIKKYCSVDSKFYFIPNLIDETEFYNANILRNRRKELRYEYNIPIENFVFICPARLTYVKGIMPFLKLYVKTKEKNNSTILIPGDGEMKKEIDDFIINQNIDVRLMGYKSQEEIITLYALSDAFLMPSISDANPLTCIEAIWAGLPLLVSEHVGNHPEVISEGENGYVFNYDDIEQTINKVEKIIFSNDDWRLKAKDKSLEIANKRYKSDKAVKELLNTMLFEYDLLSEESE